MQKLLPPAMFLICVGLMLVLHACWPLRSIVPPPYNWSGVLGVIAGLGAAFWESRRFAAIGTNIKTFGDPDTLVTDGLFRHSRNPMYLGFVVALIGICVLLGTLSPWFVATAFFVLTDRWYIRFEEARLAAKFEARYRDYAKRTRRWL